MEDFHLANMGVGESYNNFFPCYQIKFKFSPSYLNFFIETLGEVNNIEASLDSMSFLSSELKVFGVVGLSPSLS